MKRNVSAAQLYVLTAMLWVALWIIAWKSDVFMALISHLGTIISAFASLVFAMLSMIIGYIQGVAESGRVLVYGMIVAFSLGVILTVFLLVLIFKAIWVILAGLIGWVTGSAIDKSDTLSFIVCGGLFTIIGILHSILNFKVDKGFDAQWIETIINGVGRKWVWPRVKRQIERYPNAIESFFMWIAHDLEYDMSGISKQTQKDAANTLIPPPDLSKPAPPAPGPGGKRPGQGKGQQQQPKAATAPQSAAASNPAVVDVPMTPVTGNPPPAPPASPPSTDDPEPDEKK